MVIDDFTTGPYAITATALGTQDLQYQSGSMILGGARSTRFVMGDNPRNTPATFDLGSPNHLNLTLGPRQSAHIELGYGYSATGAQVPLNLDFTTRTEIVITFDQIIAPDYSYNPGLNVLAYSGRSYSTYTESVDASTDDPFQGAHPPFAVPAQ